MKFIIIALGFFFTQSALAEGYCYLGQQQFGIGEQVTFYYADEAAKIGPAYTCDRLSRVRTCEPIGNWEDARWSEAKPECTTEDSGGCADSWLEQLPDSAFSYSACK